MSRNQCFGARNLNYAEQMRERSQDQAAKHHCPDLTPSDFPLFGLLKKHLAGHHFRTDVEVQVAVLKWLHNLDPDFFYAALRWSALGCALPQAQRYHYYPPDLDQSPDLGQRHNIVDYKAPQALSQTPQCHITTLSRQSFFQADVRVLLVTPSHAFPIIFRQETMWK
ncbi:hypothetical protein AVEN_33987-1 [Araneus ventricosus]|uniref:Uncharacterized protein n=1 Tax=Araneus ventricosus TaxID=182803 RepID=A0A4Y2E8C1_ARAVE|nr:hypothetical protein AVEN_33987-1 [Araneus ventricosus]